MGAARKLIAAISLSTVIIAKANLLEGRAATVYFLPEAIEELKKAGLKVKSGLLEKECIELNRGFFSRINRNRPFVICKIACSLDGGIGLKTGGNKWITSKESRADVHKLRASSDAILTGIGTVLADSSTDS